MPLITAVQLAAVPVAIATASGSGLGTPPTARTAPPRPGIQVRLGHPVTPASSLGLLGWCASGGDSVPFRI